MTDAQKLPFSRRLTKISARDRVFGFHFQIESGVVVPISPRYRARTWKHVSSWRTLPEEGSPDWATHL